MELEIVTQRTTTSRQPGRLHPESKEVPLECLQEYTKAIPDVYGEKLEERIEIMKLIVYNGSGFVGSIFQISSMSRFRIILPFVYWSVGINHIDGIDDMFVVYGALISAGVTSLHFRGIPQDEIVRALQWNNDELERREVIPECLEFKELKILSMLNINFILKSNMDELKMKMQFTL